MLRRLGPRVPRLVPRHTLYTVVDDKTEVDKEIVSILRTNKKNPKKTFCLPLQPLHHNTVHKDTNELALAVFELFFLKRKI